MQASVAAMMGVVVVAMVGVVVQGVGTLVVPVVTTGGITTSVGLSAAGAAAAGLGAVALGATAVALVATKRADRTTHGRHRRAIRDEKVEEVLAMVATVDTQGCGMRHVCEVFRKDKNILTPTENSIRLLIGEKPQEAGPSDFTHPSVLYESAAILGQHGKDCFDLYRSCPLTHDEVNEYLATLDLDL
ncbi:uncharacterized protein LOC123519273 isoform X1 [Portunus trituberculatus]|uniref:uncharacterized protein LOC123519273 isoform X1 n=1 Tax=Portunus trituberculatus TaxID=210409 RepID=UPI001E1CEE93|nr:uncharacterized protein LOC123519273 isoform X1 [Portunus trituberculatus]